MISSFVPTVRAAGAALALAAVALLAAAAWTGADRADLAGWLRTVIWIQPPLTFLVILAAWLGERVEGGGRSGVGSGARGLGSRRWLLAVLVVALAARLLLLTSSGELSDDAARYHWDGKVLCHGLNPFGQAPDSPAVAHLHTHPIDARINHPWNVTCYPPLAQAVFAVAYRLTPGSLLGWRLLMILAETATWWLMIRALDRRGLPRSRLLLVAWLPLLAWQSLLPGHVDTLVVPLMVLLLDLLRQRRPLAAGCILGAICLIKPLPLLLLPAAWRQFDRLGAVLLTGTVAVTVGVAYLPFLSAGWGLFTSTWLMATDWSFNGSAGRVAEWLLPLSWAHLLSVALTAAGILLAAWRGRDLLQRGLLSATAFVAFTPTLFPWYLLFLVPLVALRPDPALLWLMATIPLADQVAIAWQTAGLWDPAWWAWTLQYIPFFLLLALGARRRLGMFAPLAAATPAVAPTAGGGRPRSGSGRG